MQMLQRVDPHFATLQGRDSFRRSPRRCKRRNRGNARRHGRAADRLLVEPGLKARGRIDDELDALALDKVDHVGSSFFHLVDPFDVHAGGFDHVRRSGRGHEFEPHVYKLAGNLRHMPLVVVGHADKDGSLRRQFLSGSQLCFGERFAEVIGDTHHFAGRFHFWPEDGVDTRKFIPREYGRLHVIVASGVEIGAALNEFRQELAQLAARHESRRDLRQRDARRFRNEGHGARGSWVHFEHVNLAALRATASGTIVHARNRELNVHEPNHLQRASQLEGVVAHALKQRLRNIHCGQHARRIARMNTGLFDVLHDAADHDVLAVGQRVDIDFDRIFQEMVDQHRAVV